ncbi:hypothetical protein G7092_21595 [Mucilaginibacter sp. HC2]|uniref:hypothetical protein n=1 Tax=Mucilaginibacter inviolabilis TaxID=2714892 RepID=UPI001407FCB1|nr:hypothetical protein [Mucilaginibacter inviolabilis]NHA06419.1 hypothetical protein [Mucilaginibacter inviolabilis]
MKVKLIPVIEVVYYSEDIPMPEKSPYWTYPVLWDNYNAANYIKAGFKDKFKPYLPGSTFYTLSSLSEGNLTKIIKDRVDDITKNKYARTEVSPLNGGYVLNIDDVDVYFPQCCGDLSDINYWKELVFNNQLSFFAGHPEPQLEIKKDTIIFDFEVGEFDEHFVPPPAYNKIEVNKVALKAAIEHVNAELHRFADTIRKISIAEQLDIPDIDKLLIWDE